VSDTETSDEPWTVEAQDDELAALRADREVLASVSEDLVHARVAIAMAVANMSPRTRKRVRDYEVAWVKVPVHAARALIEEAEKNL
jgi:hypothetical protein